MCLLSAPPRTSLPSVFGQALARLYLLWLSCLLFPGAIPGHTGHWLLFPSARPFFPAEPPLTPNQILQPFLWGHRPGPGASLQWGGAGLQCWDPAAPPPVPAGQGGEPRGGAPLARLTACAGRQRPLSRSPWTSLLSVRARRWLPPPCATAPIPI